MSTLLKWGHNINGVIRSKCKNYVISCKRLPRQKIQVSLRHLSLYTWGQVTVLDQPGVIQAMVYAEHIEYLRSNPGAIMSLTTLNSSLKNISGKQLQMQRRRLEEAYRMNDKNEAQRNKRVMRVLAEEKSRQNKINKKARQRNTIIWTRCTAKGIGLGDNEKVELVSNCSYFEIAEYRDGNGKKVWRLSRTIKGIRHSSWKVYSSLQEAKHKASRIKKDSLNIL